MSRFESSKGPTQRQLRVGEQVRHALVELLQHGAVSDPALDGVVLSVSEVRMSPDLKIATVFVTALGGNTDAAVIGLARNAKFIRGRLAGSLGHMKFMPSFRFLADTSFDNFEKIDRILKSPEVARDLDHGGDEEE